jgi:acyl-CoA thioester hydrolase
MKLLHTSVVEADEIDALGHLNVRYYMSRAQAANRALLAQLGLGPEALEALGARLVQADSYTRYHREQFKGATLNVRGGVLEVGRGTVRAYFEVDNDAKGEVAATFVIVMALADRGTRAPLSLPDPVVAATAGLMTELPAHGQPRTVDLGTPKLDVSYEAVAARLGDEIADPMSRRLEATIAAEDCDAYGFLSDTEDMMFGMLRNMRPADDGRPQLQQWGPPTFTTDAGHRFGWASLETRIVRVAQPRAGDKVCSIGAEIGLHDKVRHSRRWLFNRTSGQVVSMNDNIALALDLDARRPIAIPAELRSELEKRHLPEFA